ncbi:MAG: nucleotidyltransferase domain-containing protein [Pyrobaculum sp.]
MALDKWIEVAKARDAKLKDAVRRFVLEHCPHGDVVLFGSRTRGDDHALSDWDIPHN